MAIDFELTEEHKMLQQAVAEFVDNEVIPTIKEYDLQQKFNPQYLEKMKELGLLGISIPEKYDGAGMDYISLGLACEELERGDTSLRVIMSVHMGLNSLTLLQWGNEEQKEKYLKPQARGEKIGTFGLTEPGAGSDVASLRTTAKKDGDYYILNGNKLWISLADVADNFLVFAKTDPHAQPPHRGISAFIVERGFKGVQTGTIHNKLGVRAGNTGEIILNNVAVPKENLLGEEGEGFKIAMSALDNGRYTVAAGAVGLARAALEASIKYAHERTTFGKKIAEHQLVKEMIAEMVAGIETSKLLVLKAGWMKNKGLRNTKETSLAKWYACDVALKCADYAIQIHGAYGYSAEFPVERYWRNARGAVIYEGTREIHKLIQADYALGFRKDKPLRRTLPPYKPEE